MITVTIHNADDIANQQSGHHSVASGRHAGINVQAEVRNNVIKGLRQGFEENDIEVEMKPTKANAFSVDIKDTSAAAKKQGWISYIVSKLFSGTLEKHFADQIHGQLSKGGLEVTVDVE